LNDLASQSAAAARVSKWRGRMIAHLAPRGDAFVKNGKLVPRPQDMPASPNFPDRKQ
jgi:arylsulfatase